MTRRSGFTLIELVVVIMILGILAGVAAPKLFNTSATATDNGLKQSLSIIRDAIELYNARYGSLPVCDGTGGADFKTSLSEFMRGPFPKLPVGPTALQNWDIKVSTDNPLAADAAPAMGWMYNATTGEFIANYPQPSANSGPTYDTF